MLRLNVPFSAARLVLPAILPGFLTAYPDIRVEIVAEDNFVDVLAAGYDAGIRYDERIEQDMSAVPIGPCIQRFATAAAPAYLDGHERAQFIIEAARRHHGRRSDHVQRYGGKLIEVDGLRRGERRHRAVGLPLVSEDDGVRLGQVGVGRPSYFAVGRSLDYAGPQTFAGHHQAALGIETVPQRGPGEPGFSQHRLRCRVIPRGRKGGRGACTIHRYACAAPAYLQRWGEPETIEVPAAHDLSEMPAQNGRPRPWCFTHADEPPITVEIEPRIAVGNPATLHRLVANGAGIGCLSGYLCTPDIAADRLIQLFSRVVFAAGGREPRSSEQP